MELTQEQRQAVALAAARRRRAEAEKYPTFGVDTSEEIEPQVKNRVAEFANALKPAMVAGGSMVGSVVGTAGGTATGGPVGGVLGFAGGGALGAAGGAQAHTVLMETLRAFGTEGIDPPPQLLDQIRDAASEAYLDLAFTTAVGGIPGAVGLAREGRRGISAMLGKTDTPIEKAAIDITDPMTVHGMARALGVTPQSARQARTAEGLGVDVGILQATEGQIPGFFAKVLARFPLIGGRVRKQITAAQEQAMAAQERLMIRIGPSMNMADLGMDLNRAADHRFKVFRDRINTLYDGARQMAEASNTTMPSASMKKHADSALQLRERTLGPLNEHDPTVKFLRMVSELDDTIPFVRYDGLTKQLDETMNIARNDGYDISTLAAFKKEAVEPAIKHLSNPDVARHFQNADAIYERLMKEVFNTPTANRFNRVVKDRFRLSYDRPTAINMDTAFDTVFKQQRQSPQAMRDLRRLIRNDDIFNAAVRAHVDDAFMQSVRSNADGKTIFDLGRPRRVLGLNNKQSGEYLAMREALSGTGTKIGDLEALVDTMELTLRGAPDSVNTFIARRATLGGRQALMSTLTAGALGTAGGAAAGGIGLVSAAGFLIAARNFGRIISSPDILRAATITMDPTIKSWPVKKAALRVLAMGVSDDPAADFQDILLGAIGTPEEDGLQEVELYNPAVGRVQRQ